MQNGEAKIKIQWQGRELLLLEEDIFNLLLGYGDRVLRPVERLEKDYPFSGPEKIVMAALKRAEEEKNKTGEVEA